MTEREQQILDLIRHNPLIAQQAIADQLGISRSAVAGHIMNLTQKGVIQGKGYVLAKERYSLVIGGANMDILGRACNPLKPADSNIGNISCSAGGVARNIAENLARLGNSTRLITAIGEDNYGQQIAQQCRAAGVNMQSSLSIQGAATSTYLSVLDNHQDLYVAINDMAIMSQLSADVLKGHHSQLQSAELLILDTNLTEPALEYLLSHFPDVPVFVDPVSCSKALKIKPYLAEIHTLKPNLQEAQTLSGIEMNGLDELPRVADWFLEQGVSRLVITLGASGVFYSDGQTQGHLPAPPVEMKNANGAGDAFTAGLAHGWLKQWSTPRSIEFAMAAAALALSHIDTINPNLSETSVTRTFKEFTC